MSTKDIADASPWRALVLAAGAGTRMGGRKLLRTWRGRALLHHALEAAWAAPVDGVTLVVGADAAEVSALARDVARGRRLEIVEAADWADGMSRSLRAGIAALPDAAKGALVFLGDMPRVPEGVAGRLLEALTSSGALAAAPVYEGRRGHPALLSRALFPELMRIDGDRAAGPVLDALGDRLVMVETDDGGVLYDVDTPDLLEA